MLKKGAATVKTKMHYCLLLAVPCILTILLSACGSEAPSETSHDSDNPRTLTIAMMSYDHLIRYHFINQVIGDLVQAKAEVGTELTSELTTYTRDEREGFMQRFQVSMMAGQGYDIFVPDGQSITALARLGLLTDIYTLIDNDPYVSRDDFFTNVLNAYEYDGGLYVFPLSFEFEYVGINARLPQSFIDRFAQLSTVTTMDLVEIYNDLIKEYPEDFGYMQFGFVCSVSPMWCERGVNTHLAAEIWGKLDTRANVASLLEPSFVNFLDGFSSLLAAVETNVWGRGHVVGMPSSPGSRSRFMDIWADNAVFHTFCSFSSPMYAMFELNAPYFVYFTPLADSSNRLISINDSFGSSINFSVTSQACGDLAWAFINQALDTQMLSSISYGAFWHELSITTPIRRADFRPRTESILEHTINNNLSFSGEYHTQAREALVNILTPEGQQRQIDTVIARLEIYNSMPIAPISFLPAYLFEDIVDDLLFGLITAHDAAQRLQNRLSLWLIE